MRRTIFVVVGLLAWGMGMGTARATTPPRVPVGAADVEIVEQGFEWIPETAARSSELRWAVMLHNPNPDTWLASGSVEAAFNDASGAVVETMTARFNHLAPGETQAVGSRDLHTAVEPVSMTVTIHDVSWVDVSILGPGELTATIASDTVTRDGYRLVVIAVQSTLPVDARAQPIAVLRDRSGKLLGAVEGFAAVPAGEEVGAEVPFFFESDSAANLDVQAGVDWDQGQSSGQTNPPPGVQPLQIVEEGSEWYAGGSQSGASWAAFIRNPNADNWVAQSVEVTTTFRDANGTIIGADVNTDAGDILPGQTIAVATNYTWSPHAASIDVRAIAYWSQFESMPQTVTFSNAMPQYDGTVLSRVTADMTVSKDLIGEGVSVALVYRDDGGAIVGGRNDFELPQSATTSVDVTEYTQVTGVATVELYGAYTAQAKPLIAPAPHVGRFRPTGTFSPEVTANIPSPSDVSTDPPVMFANLLLAAIAVLALTVGIRLLNTTLVAHEDALEGIIKPARVVGRWWRGADRAIESHAGPLAGAIRIGGVLLFYGVLFSFLEPGWRPWTVSGLFVLVVMTIAFGVVGTGDDLVEMRSARRWGLPARLIVKPALVLLALGSVVLTKFAKLVPGLLIGTPEAFSMENEVSERDETRLAMVGLGSTALIGLGAWALATPLDGMLDGSGGATQGAIGAAVTLLVLIFAVSIENLFANLLAFRGSEGAAIRRRSRLGWFVALVAVTGLFFHTLINPGGDLAESMRSTNVRVVLTTVGVFLGLCVAAWAWFRRRDRRQPGEQFAPPAGPPTQLPPPTEARELAHH